MSNNGMDYRKIVDTYFQDNAYGKNIYLIHVTLVTRKALCVGIRSVVGQEPLRFIEEAGMLHDIGCCRVHFSPMRCKGSLPYLCHMTEGEKILIAEGFPRHAGVACTHTGVGMSAEEVRERELPLEERDYIPETIEEKIISYADLFYSKDPEKLFFEKTPDQVREQMSVFGDRHRETFTVWHKEFGV